MKRLLLCLMATIWLLLPLSALAEGEDSAPEILDVTVKNGVVRISASENATAYCFTLISVAPAPDSPDWLPMSDGYARVMKMDGAYYLFLRNASNAVSEPCAVSVESEYAYVIDAAGLIAFSSPFPEVLAERGSSIDSLNRYLAMRVFEAGLQTRAGVVTAAVAFASRMAQLGITVPYQLYGRYQDEDSWGVNPEWGSKLAKPIVDDYGTYRVHGMHCVAILVWAYRQACVNLVNEFTSSIIGKNGGWKFEDDNTLPIDAGQGGDLITTRTGHAMMILDRLDTDGDGAAESYLVLEMVNPSMRLVIHTFRSVKNYTLYDMTAVFQNEGRFRRFSKYWEDTYMIPVSSWPDYLIETIALLTRRDTPFTPSYELN